MSENSDQPRPAQNDRRARLSVLASANPVDLRHLWQSWCEHHGTPDYRVLRVPEIGTVMVRGRAGAVGTAFNLGEMTVTRCSVELPDGAVGHGYVQGRDKKASLVAGLIDALAQGGQAAAVDGAIVQPLAEAASTTKAERAAKAAATKVDFFTMVRGESS